MVRAVVDAYRQQTRTTAEVLTLGKWAEAHQRGDAAEGTRLLAVARSIGEALQRASGESLLRDAVAAIENSPDATARARLAEAHVLYLRGRLAYSRRQPAAAEPDLRRAASLFASAGDPMALVARYYAASIRYDLNDVAGASRELSRLLQELDARPSYVALAAQVRWQLALCTMVDDDWQATTSLLQASRAGFGRLGERSNGGFLDALLANALGAMGRSDDGWAARIRSFEALSDEGQSDRVPASLSEAATMEIRAGRPEVARSILEIEESVNRASGFDLLLAYGLVRAAVLNVYLGDEAAALSKARDAERTARGLPDPALRTRAVADANLAIGAATSDRTSLTRAIDGYQAIERASFLPEARLFRARTELRDGNVDAALRDIDAGIAEMERHRVHFAGSVSGRGVFDAGTELFRHGMRIALDRGDVAGAFRYAQRARAYYVANDGSTPAISVQELQARLQDSGTAVLELVVLPEELLAFCITADSVDATRSGVTSVQLAELVARDGNAGRLYDWLIRPSEASIAAAQQLIVVPDPVLESVSFAGLWDAREKRHLIERLAVAVAPSAGSLRPETGPRDLQSVTAIALPTGEQGENVALPQASAELKATPRSMRSGRTRAKPPSCTSPDTRSGADAPANRCWPFPAHTGTVWSTSPGATSWRCLSAPTPWWCWLPARRCSGRGLRKRSLSASAEGFWPPARPQSSARSFRWRTTTRRPSSKTSIASCAPDSHRRKRCAARNCAPWPTSTAGACRGRRWRCSPIKYRGRRKKSWERSPSTSLGSVPSCRTSKKRSPACAAASSWSMPASPKSSTTRSFRRTSPRCASPPAIWK
jgi:hypothetical protein